MTFASNHRRLDPIILRFLEPEVLQPTLGFILVAVLAYSLFVGCSKTIGWRDDNVPRYLTFTKRLSAYVCLISCSGMLLWPYFTVMDLDSARFKSKYPTNEQLLADLHRETEAREKLRLKNENDVTLNYKVNAQNKAAFELWMIIRDYANGRIEESRLSGAYPLVVREKQLDTLEQLIRDLRKVHKDIKTSDTYSNRVTSENDNTSDRGE